MRQRTARLRATAAVGAVLVMAALFSTLSRPAPVTATGTGNCDPYDITCLRAANLYASDICAVNNTTCLQFYQALGLPICAPTNATCAAQNAAVIATTTPASNVVTINGTPAGTPLSAAQATGTAAASAAPGQYGINICPSKDTSCLQQNQAKGIPICPPDDMSCLSTYASANTAIPTYTGVEQTSVVLPRYAVGVNNNNGSGSGNVGVIHTYP